jgi:preprotein translocase subunit SecG
MESIYTLLFVLQVVVAVALIGFVLIQHGKGADAGAAFGSGSSSTVFGSQGSGSFLTKVTTFLAILFLANSLLLAYLSTQKIREAPVSLLDTPASVVEQEEVTTEVVPDEESDGGHEGHGHDVPDLPIE